jgi:hypothetical protein
MPPHKPSPRHPRGDAPQALEKFDGEIRADGFVFITGEYNWGVQPPEESHRPFS